MKLDVERVGEIIENISRKYSRNTSIPKEDFSQELWVKALEIDVDEYAYLTRCLVNYAVDISRKSWRVYGNEDYSCFDKITEDRERDRYLDENSDVFEKKTSESEEVDQILSFMSNISRLGERERRFVVAKVALNSGMNTLDDEMRVIVANLSEDARKMLREYKEKSRSKTYTDDIILKVFCGIKTGVNSGSAASIRHNLREVFSR